MMWHHFLVSSWNSSSVKFHQHFQNFSIPGRKPPCPELLVPVVWGGRKHCLVGTASDSKNGLDVIDMTEESQLKDLKLRLMSQGHCSTLALFTVPRHLHSVLMWRGCSVVWSLFRTPPVSLHLLSKPDNTILASSTQYSVNEMGKRWLLTVQKLRCREVKWLIQSPRMGMRTWVSRIPCLVLLPLYPWYPWEQAPWEGTVEPKGVSKSRGWFLTLIVVNKPIHLGKSLMVF